MHFFVPNDSFRGLISVSIDGFAVSVERFKVLNPENFVSVCQVTLKANVIGHFQGVIQLFSVQTSYLGL